MLMLAAAMLVTMHAGDTSADSGVYRCDSPGGVQFSDRPCGPDSEKVHVRDNRVGGSLGDNLPVYNYEPAPEPAEEEAPTAPGKDTCRFINSTDLRTYLARNQVFPGMTREQVQRAFGRTSEVYPTPQETWVYQTKYYGALYELTYVYFRNGCVERIEYRKP
ncbi:outer membrane protein assembly factor BamE [Marinobacter sp.]|uniref:outer membrane protein assembly factor BamE domain-containing protein n=1 Tax=Marinobacter sp. TaxID=50741 RepID=UPI0035694532